MKTFLATVAHGYSRRYREPQADISRLTFVMPTKRSGAVLLREFALLSATPVIAPLIIPVTEFIESVAPNVPDSRIDLLFRLYAAYRSLPDADATLPFERFAVWGETVLADFNEIDLQMVDAAEIFTNVYDLNAIKSNFLSAEQKRVAAEYFGYSPELLGEEFSNFWLRYSTAPGKEGKGAKKRFKALWQMLLPLYEALKKELQADGLTTTGGAYREVVEAVEDGLEPFPGEKLVFVGFNALSESESRIFSALKKMTVDVGMGEEPKADFIWDMAPSVFAEEDDPALKFVSVNARPDRFPVPDWISAALSASVPSKPPAIEIVSVPSNVMQAKVAAMDIDREGLKGPTAIVLPDENLLIPVLYSLPGRYSSPNLTMGFPLRQTPGSGFVALLRKLHAGMRVSGGMATFYAEDVKELLSHPYSRMIFNRENIRRLLGWIERERVIRISAPDIVGRLGERGAAVFRKMEGKKETVDTLLDIFTMVRETIRNAEDTYLRKEIESMFAGAYTDALIRLRNCMERYNFELTARDVFLLADRLVGSETVAFEGRRDSMLQVMGVLETRCLDFRKVIMLSANEKVMPRVGREASFIPNIIRSAFCMPPANYQEEIFSYYFFRVMGRCSEGLLTYDSRSSENRNPGPSRYLLQLKYLAKDVSLRETEARFGLPTPLRGEVRIEKEGAIGEGLREVTFSASALSHYFKCPLQFLYGDVLRLREDRERMETIDSIDLGTIIHRAMEHLYFPPGLRGKMLKRPLVATPDFIKGLLDERGSAGHETRIECEARQAILKVHFRTPDDKLEGGRLRGSAAIVSDYVVRYIKNILLADLGQAPFRLWGSEIDMSLPYTLPSGETVTMRVVVDRLDQAGEEGAGAFRIVDYKTGKVHMEADGMEQVFDGTLKAANIFQLFFYAEMLVELARRGKVKLSPGISAEEFERELKVVIYKITSLPDKEGIVVPVVGKAPDARNVLRGRKIENIGALRALEEEEGESVIERVSSKIGEILDPGRPFAGPPAEDRCTLCEFRLRCEVMRAKKEQKNGTEA